MMRSGRALLLLAMLGITGCATTPPAAPAAPVAADESSASAMSNGQVAAFDRQLAAQLKLIAGSEPSHAIEVVRRDDGLPALRLADAAFSGDSGEVAPSVLAALGKLQLLTPKERCVVHVIGERIGDGAAPAVDLGERRAAAVATVLETLGMPATRLRHESRMVANRAGGVIVVIRPIVVHVEEQAWMPPAIEGGS